MTAQNPDSRLVINPDDYIPFLKTYRKKTKVLAFRMNAETGATFHKHWGEQHCRKGDWILVPVNDRMESSGDIYGCEPNVFDQTYTKTIAHAPGFPLYRKSGVVKAAQIQRPFIVHTLEGTSVGEAGDWVMQNQGGDRYMNTNESFAQNYEPVV